MAWAWAATIALILVFYFQSSLIAMSLRLVAALGLTTVGLGLVAVRRLYGTMESSASYVYLLTFGAFNLGLCAFLLVNASVPTFGLSIADTSWLSSPLLPDALVLTTIGAIAVVVGTCVGAAWGTVRRPNFVRAPPADDQRAAGALGIPGTILILGLVCAWFAIGLSSGGVHAFTGGYGYWDQVTANTPLPYVYAILGLALGMLAIGAPSAWRRAGFAVFLAYALIALLVGLRTEVLFPVATAIVMLGYRRRVLTGKRLIVVVLIVLCAISGIRSFRSTGLAGTGPSGGPISLSPQDGLAELSFGLRPMVVVLLWHDSGQPLLDGGSYTNPLTRLGHRVLPFLGPNPPAAEDPDIISSTLLEGVGPIGFSPTAEGFDNFGTIGVVGFMMLIGLALSWIDRSPRNIKSELYRTAVLAPILIEVRNTFTPVPFQILLGLGVVYLAVLLARSIAADGTPTT